MFTKKISYLIITILVLPVTLVAVTIGGVAIVKSTETLKMETESSLLAHASESANKLDVSIATIESSLRS